MIYIVIRIIQKSTVFKPTDNCGIEKARVFHLYKGSKGRIAFIGDFIKCSAIEVLPENPIPKKSKHKGILIKSKHHILKKDSSFIKFSSNSCVLLKRRLTPKGSILKGVVSRVVKRKKFISSFSKSI